MPYAEYVHGTNRILSDSDRRLVGGRPEATLFFQSIIGEIHLKVSSLGNRPQLRLHNNATSLAAFCLKGSSGSGPVSALSLLAWCSSHLFLCTWPNPESVRCKLFMKYLHHSLILLQHFTSEGTYLIYSMNPYGTHILGVFVYFMWLNLDFYQWQRPINPWSLHCYGRADPSHLWLKSWVKKKIFESSHFMAGCEIYTSPWDVAFTV